MAFEFVLPELGEGITGGDVVNVMVAVGDTVTKDQSLMELETDKAVIEVPSPVNGSVTEIRISKGGKAKVGDVVFVFETDDAAPKKEQPEPKAEKQAESKTEPPAEEKKPEAPAPAPKADALPAAKEAPKPAPAKAEVERPRDGEKVLVPASPSVRRFARELGVDVSQVPGSGERGRISIEDVKAFVKSQFTSGGPALAGTVVGIALPDFSKWGNVTHEAMSNVRRKTAENLLASWSTGPQVTQFDKCDITELEALRKKYSKQVEAEGGKLTMTAILVKVCERALKKFPQFNASIDMRKSEIVYKQYYNIGVAADTDRGLLVPVIKNVDLKNITQIAVELGELAQKARDRKLSLEEMAGGNFTISNLGGIGGTGFTPIVYQPDVAILGVSRAGIEPVWNGEAFEPRLILPLTLSYDHRLIDGADAARFLRWICSALEEPFLLSM